MHREISNEETKEKKKGAADEVRQKQGQRIGTGEGKKIFAKKKTEQNMNQRNIEGDVNEDKRRNNTRVKGEYKQNKVKMWNGK